MGAGFSAAYSAAAQTMWGFLSQAEKRKCFDSGETHRDLANLITRYFHNAAVCNIEELANFLLSEPLDPFADYENRRKCYGELTSIITWTLRGVEDMPRDLETRDIYQAFASKVADRNGSIITFNYDLLIDSILLKTKMWSPQNGYGVRIPTIAETSLQESKSLNFEQVLGREQLSSCLLLKLHGSLSWGTRRVPHSDGSRPVVQNDWGWHVGQSMPRLNPISGASSAGGGLGYANFYYDTLLIPPQIDKSEHYARPLLKLLWYIAREALAHSDVVHILGYSLPPSDFEVRRLIREAYAWRHRTYNGRSWNFRIVDRDESVASRFRDILGGSRSLSVEHVGNDITEYLRDFA
jgi:hypothetical protein